MVAHLNVLMPNFACLLRLAQSAGWCNVTCTVYLFALPGSKNVTAKNVTSTIVNFNKFNQVGEIDFFEKCPNGQETIKAQPKIGPNGREMCLVSCARCDTVMHGRL